MKAKTIITTSVIVVSVVGAALILMGDSGTVHTLMDAVAIVIVVTLLSLQAWLRDKFLRPADVAKQRIRRYRPLNGRQDRISVDRTTRVARGSFRDESAA